jgi:hypothetical protein
MAYNQGQHLLNLSQNKKLIFKQKRYSAANIHALILGRAMTGHVAF